MPLTGSGTRRIQAILSITWSSLIASGRIQTQALARIRSSMHQLQIPKQSLLMGNLRRHSRMQ